METADIVIIGGGIVGLTIAYHLAEAGAGKIVLCERKTIGSGTSSMSGAMCGQQAEITDTISRLAVRALDIYENFDERIGGDIGFMNHGILGFQSSLENAETRAQAARKNGSDARALSVDQTTDFYSEFNMDGFGASILYPRSGCVDAYRTMHAYAAGAKRLGADLREFTPVTRIDAKNGHIETLHTPQGAIAPGKVILACGPWSHKVARSAGLFLPIETTQVGVSFFRQPPDFADRPPVTSAELAIIPWHNKHFRVLRDTRKPLVRIEPDPTEAVCPQFMVDHATEVIHHRLPNMKRGRFQGAYQTCYDDTPDLKPLLGFVPGLDNLFLDCGWSGRGFKFSVSMGEYNAKWILEGKTELDLAPWLATRFNLMGA
ncbi:MAG: FAD-binding oxidoreductase [bacterium]|nr:FAD-binding oxidoreductase [bacterium]